MIITCSLTSVRYLWTCLRAVKLCGSASLLSFILQKRYASSYVSWGSFTNQNSASSMKTDVSWCPPEKHNTPDVSHPETNMHDFLWVDYLRITSQLNKFWLLTDSRDCRSSESRDKELSTQTQEVIGHYQDCTSRGSLVSFLLKHKRGSVRRFHVEKSFFNSLLYFIHKYKPTGLIEQAECRHYITNPCNFIISDVSKQKANIASCTHATTLARFPLESYRGVSGRPTQAWRHSETVWRRKMWEVSCGSGTQTGASRCSSSSDEDINCFSWLWS